MPQDSAAPPPPLDSVKEFTSFRALGIFYEDEASLFYRAGGRRSRLAAPAPCVIINT